MPPQLSPSPQLSVNGIPCGIYLGPNGDQGGIVEHWTDHGLEVKVDFLVPWGDRIGFIQALRGVAGVDGNGNVTREDPWTLPITTIDFCPKAAPYNETPYFWDSYLCIGTDPFRPIKPLVDQDGSVTGIAGWVFYEYVVIPARFAVTPYQIGEFSNNYNYGDDLSGYPYTSIKARASGEAFQAWYNAYVFTATQAPASDVVIIRPRQEFTITRYMMPYVDTDKYDNLIGKVNENPLTIGTTFYGSESVLYMGYEPEWISDPSTGLLFYNIHHTVMANGVVRDADDNPSSSWNMYLTKTGRWRSVSLRTNAAKKVYDQADFTPVIWPETAS